MFVVMCFVLWIWEEDVYVVEVCWCDYVFEYFDCVVLDDVDV